ncbi:MAG: S8 family serine peptidase, partial [bacterium]
MLDALRSSYRRRAIPLLLGLAVTGTALAGRPAMSPARRFTPAPGAEINNIRFSNGLSVDTRTGATDAPAGLRADPAAPGPQLSIVQFTGPVERGWRRQLERKGIQSFGYLAPYAVLARLDADARARAAALPFVRWVGPFHPGYKLEPGLPDARGMLELALLLVPGADEAPVRARLDELGALTRETTRSPFGVVLRLQLTAAALADLARLDEVLWIQQWTEPDVCNNAVQWVTQTGWRSSVPPDTSLAARRVWQQGIRGRGLVLSTTDTGLNTGHDMFRDPGLSITPPGIWPGHRKVVAFKLYAGADPGESPRHGSHVNGTVAGDDSVTGGTSFYDGMAKDARLYFVDVSASGGGFVIGTDLWPLWDTVYLGRGLPDSLRPVVQHSGSWGWSNTQGTYLLMDASTDAYCWAHKDFLNIMAAGNESSTRRLRNPGIAKNVLTVGATGNGTAANTIASFSSRGPTQDGRTKPNVVAPGVGLWSARMAPATNTYEQLSGTSMATPAANGAIGLMRQYLRDGYYPTGGPVPGDRFAYISAALLRSMAMVSGDPNVGSFTVPDNNIGWGRVDADSVLYFTGDTRRLLLLDDTVGVATAEYKELQFRANSALPLKASLAWTDTAAAPNANPTLVNNLNLELVSPSGTQYRGNQFSGGQSVPNPSNWDNLNVEEGFRVNAPETGTWTLRVYGQNVATAARQPFAWTVTGDVEMGEYDVGVTSIVAPVGLVDSGATVTPACSVHNYGNITVSYPVRLRIGAGYDTVATVLGHLAGTSRLVQFPAWIATHAGSNTVSCSTELARDREPANDRRTDSVFVARYDAEALAILSPAGTLDSTTGLPVRARVRNNGNTTVSFPMVFRVTGPSAWADTALVSNLVPGGVDTVDFTDWPVGPRGTYALACSTRLPGDGNPGNNRQTGSLTVLVRDVGCTHLLAPSGTVDSGAVVVPACSVYNHGTTTENYPVRMRIGTGYDEVIQVTGHAPGTRQRVAFPGWTASGRSSFGVSCSTGLETDMLPGNDRQTGTVLVRVLDVGVVSLQAPAGLYLPGDVVTPTATWHNPGSTPVDFEAWMILNDPTDAEAYRQKADVAGLEPGSDIQLQFPPCTLQLNGPWSARCSTWLAGDADPDNDLLDAGFTVGAVDAGIVAILTPGLFVDTGATVVPSAQVRNYSEYPMSFNAWFVITDETDTEVYRHSVAVTGLAGGETRDVAWLEDWPGPHPEGRHAARCSLAVSDEDPANNQFERSFVVAARPPWPAGWVEVAPMPLAPSGKPARRGAWLALNPGDGLIYAAKGYKTQDFYRYDPMADAWTELASPPADPVKGRPLEKGARGVTDGDNTIYMVHGNNTVAFWKYDIAANEWTGLADVPLGPSGKRVKGGGDLVHVTVADSAYLYFLKGDRLEFYRYDIASGQWQQLADMPVGIRNRVKRDGWLAWDGGNAIYALKPNYFDQANETHEFWQYDIAGDSWLTNAELRLAGMPLWGMHGGRIK